MWWPATGSAILKVRKSYIDGAVNSERKHVLECLVASHRQRNIEGGKIIHRWRWKILVLWYRYLNQALLNRVRFESYLECSIASVAIF
jgi:hypothetical protein